MVMTILLFTLRDGGLTHDLHSFFRGERSTLGAGCRTVFAPDPTLSRRKGSTTLSSVLGLLPAWQSPDIKPCACEYCKTACMAVGIYAVHTV